MPGVNKRPADVPSNILGALDGILSKADLWEMVYALAGLCNGADSCDDDEATYVRLVVEANAWRRARGAKPLDAMKLLDAHEARRAKVAARRAAMGGAS